jgi:exodeoxyribonuclease V alpha subunit
MAVNNNVFLLTGGPGTGKTTVIRGILAAFGKLGMRVTLAAPTGRAAKRMTELCECEAKTLHRMLEVTHDESSFGVYFARNEKKLLETDVLIIDEMSMVDVTLMEATLRALPAHAKLILVGDADQLPSVGAGNVFKDLLLE